MDRQDLVATSRKLGLFFYGETDRVGQLTNTDADFEYLCVGFVTEISEIAILNYLKLLVWIAIRSLQPNYSQWGVN